MGDDETSQAGEDQTSSATAEDQTLLQLFSSHLPFAFTLVGLLLAILKVYRVAGGSTETALAVVQASGASTILFSAVLAAVPSLFGFVLWWCAVGLMAGVGAPLQRRVMLNGSTVELILAFVTLGIARVLVNLAILSVVILGLRWLGRHGEKWNMLRTSMR